MYILFFMYVHFVIKNKPLILYHCIKLFSTFIQSQTDSKYFLGFGLIAMQFLK